MTPQATGRVVAITLPPGMPLLTSNQRSHWAEKARRTKALRTAAWALTRQQNPAPMDRARVIVTVHPPTRRHFDPPNFSPTGKAAIDGMTDAGLWPDDDATHVTQVTYQGGDLSGTRYWRVAITAQEAHDA